MGKREHLSYASSFFHICRHFAPFCAISSLSQDWALDDRLYVVWYMCS